MKWVATAVWGVSDLTNDQLVEAADDLDGDMGYDLATGLLSVHFELIATTRKEAVATARHLAAAMPLPQPVASITVQPCRPRPPIVHGHRDVDALTPGINGSWLVKTQGSDHIWNLDHETYTRIPQSHSRSGAFAFDHQPMSITRVERWPRIGSTSLLWYNDPTDSDLTEHWRQSSSVVSITEIQMERTWTS
jgi:hypothetical protein